MINPADFGEGEFEQAFNQLKTFNEDEAVLTQEVMKYFSEFDNDNNAFLDRGELRRFLNNFFGSYHIRVPITDEYVDAVFRSIDTNHDNKIQPEELTNFSKLFIGNLVNEFTNAAARQAAGAEEEKTE